MISLITLDFHPLADNVMVAVDAAKTVKLFNIEAKQEMVTLPDVHKAILNNVSWNKEGSQLATAGKDKTLRIFDPRSNSVAGEAPDHAGAKGSRVLWTNKNDFLFTVGFGKSNDRMYALYDPRNMSKRVTEGLIDTSSSSTLFPFYEPDNNIIFVAGKGDGNIRFYELSDEAPHVFYLNEYKSKDPQTGVYPFRKTSVDVMKCEILRMAKLQPNGLLIPIKFEVPRVDAKFFQEDLFPDTFNGKPSMTADDWFSGANKPGATMSLDPEKRK